MASNGPFQYKLFYDSMIMWCGTTANSAHIIAWRQHFHEHYLKNSSNTSHHYYSCLKLLASWTFSHKVSNGRSKPNSLKNLIHEARVLGKDPPICLLFALIIRKLTDHFTGPELYFPASERMADVFKRRAECSHQAVSTFPLPTYLPLPLLIRSDMTKRVF